MSSSRDRPPPPMIPLDIQSRTLPPIPSPSIGSSTTANGTTTTAGGGGGGSSIRLNYPESSQRQGFGTRAGSGSSSTSASSTKVASPTKSTSSLSRKDSLFSSFSRNKSIASFDKALPSPDLPPPRPPAPSSHSSSSNSFSLISPRLRQSSTPTSLSRKQEQLLGTTTEIPMSGAWDGWNRAVETSPTRSSRPRATPLSPKSSFAGGSEVIAPWAFDQEPFGNSMMTTSSSKGTPPLSSPVLYTSRNGTKSYLDPDSPKEKKRGFMSALLKRKNSRSSEPKEGYFDDSGIPIPTFENIPLPAKLQARGDTADPLPIHISSKSGKVVKRAKKPPFALPTPSRSLTPSTNHVSVYEADPEISLDTNLDSMEGIVNLDAIGGAGGGDSRSSSFSSSLNGSTSPIPCIDLPRPSGSIGSLTHSPSSHNLSLDPSSPAPHRRRPSVPFNYTRRSSLDPAGGLAFPLLPETSPYRSTRQMSVVSAGSNGRSRFDSDLLTMTTPPPVVPPLPRSSSIEALVNFDQIMNGDSNGNNERTLSNSSSDHLGGTNHLMTPGSRSTSEMMNDRRPSTAPTVASVGGATTEGLVAAAAAAWTAPDSWAVKGGMAIEHESSSDECDDDHEDEQEEEEEEEEEEHRDVEVAAQGEGERMMEKLANDQCESPVRTEMEVIGVPMSPRMMLRANGGTSMSGGSGSGRGPSSMSIMSGVRPSTAAGGRPTTKNGRPGTADNARLPAKNFMIRVFRPDSSFSTLPVPLAISAAELQAMLAKKFMVNVKAGHALYLREKGLERRMGVNEKPLLLQKRRFEQAGYTDLDPLDDIGREDNSYLSKLVYKPHRSSVVNIDDDSSESLEFVDLSGRSVETIPIFLYRHAHEIVSLNLSKNRPFDLPTDFVQLCASLRELVLSHMGLKRIPPAVRECINLTRLDLSNNHIVELEHIALDELIELTSLKCHNNRLWTLPDYFVRFRQLKYLNLSNNRFEIMPAVVCDIIALVELDISFNTLTSIPLEIGHLKNMERLVLLANSISSLPPTFNSLVRLKELDCRRNVIADLSAISGVPLLEVLRCEHNQTSALDANWSNMRILTAANNSITRFILYGTGNTLTSLNLSNAKLSSLATDMFEHLGSVENLTFDGNQIRVLPEGVGSLSNLVHLSMKNNLLDNLPASIGKLQRLQTLSLSGNNLPSLPAQIWLCSQLTVLNASSNMLHDFPDPPLTPTNSGEGDDADVRKMSTISKAPSTSSGRIAPPLALSLQKLYLGDNRLTDDVFAPISLMAEVRILNLSFNDLYEIPPSSLFKCQQLEELYLSGNKLTSLPPDDLERLVNLKLIYVNGNKLQTLPAELGKIRKLFALDVGSNVLKYNIANWPYDWNWNWNLELRYLNLSGNKRLEIKPGHQNEPPNLDRSSKRRNLADFSALTKLRVLGLMDVTLMIPSVPDESEDRRVRTSFSEINDMGYGIADTLGSRVDTLSLVDIVVPRFRAKDDEAIFGLFDAVHKGQATGGKLVKYLQDYFTAIFTLELSRLKSGEVTSDALRRAFLGINRDYGNMLLPSVESLRKGSDVSLADRSLTTTRTGAAGIIVYVKKKKMYVANAGNALAVISGRGGSARLISKKHEPFDAAEIARIRTAEGWISHRGYVNDEADVSRSFGFYNVFPAINASPNIEEIELADSDEFVIIANRGLWEHMSYQSAVDVARKERSDPMLAAAKLRDLAISYGSSSSIMVMVLAVGDLFKAKRDYRMLRGVAHAHDDEGFYGAHKSGAAMRRGKEDGAGERYLNLLDREVAPPVGMVALVFTDIRNSTALWESNPGMQTAIRMHNQLLRRQLRAIGGYEVKTEGDAFMVSFHTVTSALLWALTVQMELLREDWPQEILDSEEGKEILNAKGQVLYRGLSVRMGIHFGSPVCEADPITRRMDYLGAMVNRSSRISSVADGGQICVSQDVVDIIQHVVMETPPELLEIDRAEGEIPEEEVWLDPSEKRDVLALRRLGFGIIELGERRLKGLEAPELLSLIWPKSLKERNKAAAAEAETGGAHVAEVHDPSTQIIEVNLVKSIGRACLRLEAAVALIVHGQDFIDDTQRHGPPSSTNDSTPTLSSTALVSPHPSQRKTIIHPSTLIYPIRPDATDEELTALLETYIIRIENVVASLVLYRLGPYAETLAALGAMLKTDPKYLLNALSRFANLMG